MNERVKNEGISISRLSQSLYEGKLRLSTKTPPGSGLKIKDLNSR